LFFFPPPPPPPPSPNTTEEHGETALHFCFDLFNSLSHATRRTPQDSEHTAPLFFFGYLVRWTKNLRLSQHSGFFPIPVHMEHSLLFSFSSPHFHPSVARNWSNSIHSWQKTCVGIPIRPWDETRVFPSVPWQKTRISFPIRP